MALRHRRAGLLERARGVPIGEDHPQQIGERIEPQLEEAEIDTLGEAQLGELYRIDGGGACGK